MRERRTNPIGAVSKFGPGDFVKEYARRMGWDFGPCNLMLEGTTDVSYLTTASRLQQRATGMRLIDEDFRVFAVGRGDEGGTEGIKDKLRLLSENLRLDPVGEGEQPIRVIAVFDDDAPGRGAFKQLGNKFVQWRDIFLVKRYYPQNTRDPRTFDSGCKKLNSEYAAVFCEIEDLLERDLLDLFCSDDPRVLQREPRICGNGHHYDFHGWAKPKLTEFVDGYASVADVAKLVDFLRLFRWLFKLSPDGSPVP